MKIMTPKVERGQVVVILAFAIVGLLAFAALAIDGGMMFSDRRHAQNAADAAAMAGAYAVANNPGAGLTPDQIEINIVKPPATARATQNGYTSDAKTTVTINYPPDSGQYSGNPEYVQAIINTTVDTAFLQFAYDGEVHNTVESVAHFTPAFVGPLYNGNGLVSLSPHSCPGFDVNGNFTAVLTIGGIFVNSDCNPAVTGNSNSKKVEAPSLSSVGTIDSSFLDQGTVDIPSINQPAVQYDYPPGIEFMKPPTCIGAPNANYDPVAKKYSPPTPGGIAVIAGGIPHDFKGTFDPGVYCVDSGGFSFNAQADFEGSGVIFFVTGSQPCDWTWNGGAEIKIYGPNTSNAGGEGSCVGETCNFKKVVIYVDHEDFASYPDSKDLVLDGNNDSFIDGTIYAPTCHFKKTGGSGMKILGQIIGYTFGNIGTATLNLEYNQDDAGESVNPAFVDLVK